MSGNSAAVEGACKAAIARCESGPLPFVEADPDNPNCLRSVWTVSETGNHDADVASGIIYAEALIQRLKPCGSHTGRLALEAVLTELARKGKVGPIEQGFLCRVAMAAIVASNN